MKRYPLFGALALLLLLQSGCGPTAEEKTALAALNAMDELIEKGGYVKKFERFEDRGDRVFVIEAEIVDEKGVALGRLRSERVEGFGTSKPRIQWYKTPGEPEEWTQPARGGRRGPRGEGGPRGPRGEGGRRGPQGEGPRSGSPAAADTAS
ncbi:MAG: hypothetical protein GX130_14365 [Candidatus Hydrogenedens sp.]|nr:hypothetical protein [Candidatus Hydrogenedens sp.]